MEFDITSLDELNPQKFYHINFKEAHPQLQEFAAGLKLNGIKALITIGDVKVEDMVDTFLNLPDSHKQVIRESLLKKERKFEIVWEDERPSLPPEGLIIDPKAHEQTK